MATNNKINFVGLDYDQIRGNLVDYLKGQERF
jgi:hypothetical protein